jgi:hypothetical protein
MRLITQQFLDRLQGVKAVKGGLSYVSRCPAHDDHTPSLTISEGYAGLLLRCRSHDCSFAAIARSVGFDPSSLFWEQPNSLEQRNSFLASLSRPASPISKSMPIQPNPPEDNRSEEKEFIHISDHIYTTESGEPSIRVRRYHTPNKERLKGYKKDCIVQRYENDFWIKGLAPETKRILYNLQNIVQNPGYRIVWVEGENKVDRLTVEGILATTALGGTGGKNNLPDLSVLSGREVAILPDQDEPGRDYAETVLTALKAAGACCWIVPAYPEIAEQPPFPGYDVIDYLDHGGTVAGISEALNPPPPPPLRFPLLTVHELLALPPPVWQVPDYIQEGSLFLFYGPPSMGKSFIAMDLGINLSQHHGEAIWCDRLIKKTGPVVYINADGGSGFRDRVEAWYQANNANQEDFQFYTLNTELPLADAGSLAEFYRTLDSLPAAPAALFVDTYSRCNSGADENDTGTASRLIANLDRLRERYGPAIGLLHHTGIEGTRPRGSTVLLGAVDSSFRIYRDNETIKFHCMKQRNGADKIEGQEFFLKPTGQNGQVCLWRTGQVDKMTLALRAELTVAAYIEDYPDCIVSEITSHTGIKQQRVTEAIESLVKQKLIIRGLQRQTGMSGKQPVTFRPAYRED